MLGWHGPVRHSHPLPPRCLSAWLDEHHHLEYATRVEGVTPVPYLGRP